MEKHATAIFRVEFFHRKCEDSSFLRKVRNIYQTTRRRITENSNIQMYRHVNLRYHRRIVMVYSGNVI
jgi:hypothetical protein